LSTPNELPIGDDWKFTHVGLIVRDLDKSGRLLARLGFSLVRGPFTTEPKAADNPQTSRIAYFRKDALLFEVIQPIEGRFVNKHFLESIGEGVNHTCFEVDDFAADRARMEAMGYPFVYGSSIFGYFDTRAVGGVMIELKQRS
jgi:catechol 2,3-dioxygenase-like lactoylglutathione lyase family enzyme